MMNFIFTMLMVCRYDDSQILLGTCNKSNIKQHTLQKSINFYKVKIPCHIQEENRARRFVRFREKRRHFSILYDFSAKRTINYFQSNSIIILKFLQFYWGKIY
jgi:hypothetical protein